MERAPCIVEEFPTEVGFGLICVEHADPRGGRGATVSAVAVRRNDVGPQRSPREEPHEPDGRRVRGERHGFVRNMNHGDHDLPPAGAFRRSPPESRRRPDLAGPGRSRPERAGPSRRSLFFFDARRRGSPLYDGVVSEADQGVVKGASVELHPAGVGSADGDPPRWPRARRKGACRALLVRFRVEALEMRKRVDRPPGRRPSLRAMPGGLVGIQRAGDSAAVLLLKSPRPFQPSSEDQERMVRRRFHDAHESLERRRLRKQRVLLVGREGQGRHGDEIDDSHGAAAENRPLRAAVDRPHPAERSCDRRAVVRVDDEIEIAGFGRKRSVHEHALTHRAVDRPEDVELTTAATIERHRFGAGIDLVVTRVGSSSTIMAMRLLSSGGRALTRPRRADTLR